MNSASPTAELPSSSCSWLVSSIEDAENLLKHCVSAATVLISALVITAERMFYDVQQTFIAISAFWISRTVQTTKNILGQAGISKQGSGNRDGIARPIPKNAAYPVRGLETPCH